MGRKVRTCMFWIGYFVVRQMKHKSHETNKKSHSPARATAGLELDINALDLNVEGLNSSLDILVGGSPGQVLDDNDGITTLSLDLLAGNRRPAVRPPPDI